MKCLPAPHLLFVLLLAPMMLTLSACSTPRTFAKDSFSNDSPYQKHVAEDAKTACSAAERTLLGDGYTLDNSSAKTGTVKGRKAYRMDGGRSSFLEMSVVCLSDANGSTIYANGLISTYDLKKSANAASVGLAVIGSISLPIGQSIDSMVKVSDETITDRVFYGKFFSSVESILHDNFLDSPPPIPKTPIPKTPTPKTSTPTSVAKPAAALATIPTPAASSASTPSTPIPSEPGPTPAPVSEPAAVSSPAAEPAQLPAP
ncbi:MAG: DUF2242 domain-containing protein [Halothiobacillus sp.]